MQTKYSIITKYTNIIKQFGFVIRISDPIKNNIYGKSEDNRYTNMYLTFINTNEYIWNIHTNYRLAISDFNMVENDFKNLKISKNYLNDVYRANYTCDSIGKVEKYLHKLFPTISRELKLIKILEINTLK